MRPKFWFFPTLILVILTSTLSGCDSASHAPPEIASMDLSGNLPLVPRGGSKTLALEVLDVNGNIISWMDEGLDVAWSSSDAAVLTVDSEGVISGISRGSATVTARSGTDMAELTLTVVDLEGTWTATVPDAQAPGGVNVITYRFEQTGFSVSGTYSNLSGFPPLTSASTGFFSGTLNLRRIGSSITVRVQVPGPPCDISWTNELRLDLREGGSDQLTPVSGTVPLTSSSCPNAGQIRVAQVTRSPS